MQEEEGHLLAIWDLERHATVARFEVGSLVYGKALSGDRRLLAAGSRDGRIRIWDVASGRPLIAPKTMENLPIDQVWFSRDGRTVITTGEDRATRMTSVATGQEMIVWPDTAYSERSGAGDDPEGVIVVWKEGTTSSGRVLLSYRPFPTLTEIDAEISRTALVR
jgi:WD40 repeat protein